MITLTTIVAPAKPRPEKTYRIRKEAEAAAVMAIGPHARKGFEFEAFKCDGAWRWREFDEVRPPNAAELKASGGKKSILAAAATSGTAMAKTTDSGAIVPATYDELKASGGLRSAPVPKGDGLDLPPILKRKNLSPNPPPGPDFIVNSPDTDLESVESMLVRHLVTPQKPQDAAPDSFLTKWERVIKEQTPQKPQDAPKKAKATRTAPKTTKRASKAPAKREGASGGNRYDWEGAAETAKGGKMPKAPDFSADTHKPFRKIMAAVIAAAISGDIKALKAVKVEPKSSSRKIVARYRDLCILALKGQ